MHSTFVPSTPRVAVGFDAGGTKIRARIVDAETGELLTTRNFSTNRFRSFDELIDDVLADKTYEVAAVFSVLAGVRMDDGSIEMSNVKEWPIFNPAKTAERLGIPVDTGNDMLGAGAGLTRVKADFVKALRVGRRVGSGVRLIVTISTGIGISLMLPDGVTIMLSEGGHITWQPMTKSEAKYMSFLRRKLDVVTVTAEQAVSGGQGFSHLYDFLSGEGRRLWNRRNRPLNPSDNLAAQVREYRAATPPRPIGPLITQGALAGDPFCREIMQMFGSILGQTLRNYIVAFLPTGGLYLIGGVSKIEILKYLLGETPFWTSLAAADAKHSSLVADVPIDIITDDNLGVRGAAAIAREMVSN